MDRMIREANWGYKQLTLTAAEVAVKGHVACIDLATGLVVSGQASTTLLPIGLFAENMTGDGTKKVNVRLFEEIKGFWLDNDSAPNAVDAGDVGNSCYLKDSTTVSMLSTGRSLAGRVLAVDSSGVLVQGGMGITGPAGAAGASVLGTSVADTTALKAIGAGSRYDGKLVLVRADGSLWRFASTSVLADTSEQLVIAPSAGSGKWLRADKAFTMKLPITFATADAAVLHTVPAGFVLKLATNPYWDVATAFTGGSSASIGLSSSRSGYSTKGDLISATLLAALTAGIRAGTIGDKIDTVTEFQALFLEAGQTLRHDRIVDDFTAGAANVCVPVVVVSAPASA